jgi:hypothetical protein
MCDSNSNSHLNCNLDEADENQDTSDIKLISVKDLWDLNESHVSIYAG